MAHQQIGKSPLDLSIGANKVSLSSGSEGLTERKVARLKQQGIRISLRIDERRLPKFSPSNHNLTLAQLCNERLQLNPV